MVEDIIVTIREQKDSPIVCIENVFIEYVSNGIVISVYSYSVTEYNISIDSITA
jgi:hypothetical protein